MKYCEFEELMSPQRVGRYYHSCNQHALKTLSLYAANIRLSQAFLPILNYFEVILRNRIDRHYQKILGNQDWLLTAALSGGFLVKSGCLNSSEKVIKAYTKLSVSYTHDRLVAALSFGFWKFMFAGKQYKLDRINSIRNRIAHHEPICFGVNNTISAAYARSHFLEITDILGYMGIDPRYLFRGFKGVLEEGNYIDSI